MQLLDEYLQFLEQGAPPPGGPPAKAIHLKSSGAEQDDEEPPTTARTKKFERDEARVGLKELFGRKKEDPEIQDRKDREARRAHTIKKLDLRRQRDALKRQKEVLTRRKAIKR